MVACDQAMPEPPGEPDPDTSCDIPLRSTVVQDSLLAYYPLDGDLLDYSGSCRHLDSQGSVAFVPGLLNQALALDGSDGAISLPVERSPLPSWEYTVVAWIAVDDAILQDGRSRVVAAWDGRRFGIQNACTSAGCGPGTAWALVESGGVAGRVYTDLTLPPWLMIVYMEGWSLEEYGQAVWSRWGEAYLAGLCEPFEGFPWPGRSWNGSIEAVSSVSVGNPPETAREWEVPFEGMLDEIRIYNRILTASDLDLLHRWYAERNTDIACG